MIFFEEMVEWLKLLATALVLALLIKTFILDISIVSGQSMEPYLGHGDRLLLQKYKIRLNIATFKRGDIVVFKSPYEEKKLLLNKLFLKRIVGLPGDRINITGGKVYVNGQVLVEDYIHRDIYTYPCDYGEDILVPKDSYFVIGDNRNINKSGDSRSFGPIKKSDIRGLAVLSLLPLKKL